MSGLAWRFFMRSFRAGSWRTLLLALTVAIAALTAVGLLASRMERLFNSEANSLLAADAVFSADHPAPPFLQLSASRLPLQTAESVTFPSMIGRGEQFMLASVRAVSTIYPLRGKLSLQPDGRLARAPQPGQVYLEPRLALALGVKVGDVLQVGKLSLRIAALIEREPDAATGFSGLQPRLMMHMADLEASGLVGPGSRARYRFYVAGADAVVQAWQANVRPRLARGERLEDVRENQPEIKTALERAERFLKMTSLLTGVLSVAAILLAARRHVNLHVDRVAILRTLGASRALLRGLLLSELLLLSLLAMLLGGLLGSLAEAGLVASVRDQLPVSLPLPDWRAWLLASGIGLTLLLGACLPMLLALAATSPLRVLRHDIQPPLKVWLQWGVLLIVMVVIFAFVAGDDRLSLYLGGGLLTALVLISGVSVLILWGLARCFREGRLGLALRQLSRRPGLTGLQLGAMAIGLLGLWLLTVVEQDLMQSWKNRLPVDSPNYFAINIQPDQQATLASVFAKHGLAAPQVQPMIRGRWTKKNGQPVVPQHYQDERAQRLAEREFNLSWGETLRADNRLVAGRPMQSGQSGLSVEEGLAKTLGIRLGDQLEFDVAGLLIQAPVVNLRTVRWDSFRVNFFVVASPDLLAGQPASLITSFYLPATKSALVPDVARSLPNVTLIDVSAVLAEVRRVVELCAAALKLVFAFCILAGIAVLYAALDSTEADRRREAAILRALGATAASLRRLWLTESLLLGGLAGGAAGLAASNWGYWIGGRLLELPVSFNYWLPLASVATGAAMAGAAVWRRLARLAGTAPIELLREEA